MDDLEVIVGKVFADSERFLGRDLALTSDVQSIGQCRVIWREVMGRAPRRFPMPVWLFERFSGTDETTMWRGCARTTSSWTGAGAPDPSGGAHCP